MKIKVAILGAKGRMGTESVKAISAADDLELVASLDLGDSLDLLKSSGAKVVLDFTHPDSVMKNLEYAINSGINVVVGTTGFDSKRIEEVKALLAKNPQVGAIIAPNFAPQASRYRFQNWQTSGWGLPPENSTGPPHHGANQCRSRLNLTRL